MADHTHVTRRYQPARRTKAAGSYPRDCWDILQERHERLSDAARRVLEIATAECHGPGYCYLSIAEVAKRAGVQFWTAGRILDRLDRQGFITTYPAGTHQMSRRIEIEWWG